MGVKMEFDPSPGRPTSSADASLNRAAPSQNVRKIRMMHSLDRYQSHALAVFRIVVGLVFLQHGTQKIFGFPASAEGSQPPLLSLIGVGGVIELVGGALIILGFLTRPAAFILCGQMAVAYWFFHAPSSVFPIQNGGEGAILFCFSFLLLMFFGPGSASLDARSRSRTEVR